jgi:hypothetical protein
MVKGDCVYSLEEWLIPKSNIYTCSSQSENTKKLTMIKDLQGVHLSGKLQNIPSNFFQIWFGFE